MDKNYLLIAIALMGAVNSVDARQQRADAVTLEPASYPAITTMMRGKNAQVRKDLFAQLQQLSESDQALVVALAPALSHLARTISQDNAAALGQFLQNHAALIARQLPKALHAFVEYRALSTAERRHAEKLLRP